MENKILFRETLFPCKATKLDYFKAAVYSLISEVRPIFVECINREDSDLEDARIKAQIRAAVPGYNSTLMYLEIETNINQCIIDDDSLELNDKIKRIAESIEKYVVK